MGEHPPAALTLRTRAHQADLYAQYAGGNRAAVLDALADDVTWTSVAAPASLGPARIMAGPGWRPISPPSTASVRITGYAVERVIAEGEWVTVLAQRPRPGAGDRGRARDRQGGCPPAVRRPHPVFAEHYDTAAVLDALRAPAAR